MKKILFVCKGNIGRSQMAEAYYNHFTRSESAISAGIDDVAAKYNGHPTHEIVEVMNEEGIDVSCKDIKQLHEGMLKEIVTVVVLCDRSICPDFLTQRKGVIYQHIDDPFQKDIDGTRIVRDQIKNLIINILEQRKGERYE